MKSGVFVLAAVFILVLSIGFVSLIAQGGGGGSGDSVLLAKSSNNLNLGNTWGIFTGTIDDDDLRILADGTYVANDNDEFDYEQKIAIGSPTLSHFRDSDYEKAVGLDERTPTLGFKISSNTYIMNYTLDFIQDAESSVTSGDLDDLEGSDLQILDKTYYVSDAKSGTKDYVEKLTLFDSMVASNVEVGKTRVVNVEGILWEISIIFIDKYEVVFNVSGERVPYSKKMKVGDSFKLKDGTYISVRDIYYSQIANIPTSVSFSIERGKLELTHGQDIKLNDRTITGVKAYMPKGAYSYPDQKLDKIVIEWKNDKEVFLTEDVDLVMPGGFDNIKFTMDLVRNEEEKITIEPDGDDSIEMTVPIKEGTVSFNLLYGSNGLFTGLGKASDERLATSSNNHLTFHEKDPRYGNDFHSWFVASHSNNKDSGESYLLKAKVHTDTSSGRNLTTVDKNVDGTWVEVCEDKKIGDTCDIGDVSMTIVSIAYRTDANDRGQNVTFKAGPGVSFDKLFTKNGLTVYLPDEAQNITGYSYELLLAEEDKDGNLGKNKFSVVLNDSQGKFQVAWIRIKNFRGYYSNPPRLEKGDSGIYESYIISDVATRFLHYTKPDEDYLEIYYPGKESETYAEVYLTAFIRKIKKYKVLTLVAGWNLVPFKDLLVDPLEDISKKKYKKLFSENNIRASFVYNPIYQKYVKLHKLSSNKNVISSIKSVINSINQQSLFHTSYWLYSFSNQTISIPIENNYPLVLDGTVLYKGWNFLIISKAMMGMSLNEWSGNCTILKAAIWSETRQGWDVASLKDFNQKFNKKLLGKGIVLEVPKDCELGDNIAPPKPPQD